MIKAIHAFRILLDEDVKSQLSHPLSDVQCSILFEILIGQPGAANDQVSRRFSIEGLVRKLGVSADDIAHTVDSLIDMRLTTGASPPLGLIHELEHEFTATLTSEFVERYKYHLARL